MIGLNARRFAGFRKMKELVDGGAIGDPILEEIDEFVDCVLSGNRPETDGHGGLVALALVRAAIESARSGQQVQLAV